MENIDCRKQFQLVLEEGEEIIMGLKPVKGRFIARCILNCVLLFLLYSIFAAIFIAGRCTGQFSIMTFSITFSIATGLLLIGIASFLIYQILLYKNTFYLCTDKRLIVKSGASGTNYRFLDYFTLTTIDVEFNSMDKLFRKNTGNIIFGPDPSAGMDVRYRRIPIFAFYAIEDPYKNVKIIQKQIDEARDKQ